LFADLRTTSTRRAQIPRTKILKCGGNPVKFDPFRVGRCWPVTVGFTHRYSCCSPSGNCSLEVCVVDKMDRELVQIAYGKGRIPLKLDPALAQWHVITPKNEDALPDGHAAFLQACRTPIESDPLREMIKPTDRVVVVTSDGTRPVPNHLLIPWLLEELPVPAENVTVILGTGTHRANTPDEIDAMFGSDVAQRVCIVNHDAFDSAQHVRVGTTASGTDVLLDKAYVEADKRIAVGFIEPHFFAGYSGGPKAIAPGVTAGDTIFSLHDYPILADPNCTWDVLDGNPLHEAIVEMTGLCPPDFLVNVTLNLDKAITGFFVGDYMKAHRAGCARVREYAMAPVPCEFPIVITSNSGYPLDQNVYQSVKGMSAAKRIVTPGGTIIMASACNDGVPSHGNFGAMLREHDTVEAIDAHLQSLPAPVMDQWEVQVLLQILERCEVQLYSQVDAETVRECKLVPVDDLQIAVESQIKTIGTGAPVAVLPEGPLTIPYLHTTSK